MNYNLSQQKAIDATEDNIIIRAPAGSGKALDNKTGVLTPTGYKPIGKIQVGDTVFDGSGQPTKVVGVYPQGIKQVYNITFSNGKIIRCCQDHLWKFQTKTLRDDKSKTWLVKTTQEIINTIPIYRKSGKYDAKNIYLPTYEYVNFAEQELPLKPYLLGALLGDGTLTDTTHNFSNADSDIIQRVDKELREVNKHLVYQSNYDYRICSVEFSRRICSM